MPTGEILPARRWSFSVYRVNFDYEEGFTDVSNWPVTFGVGLADRAEIFAAWDVVRRIDRDVRPVFTSNHGIGRVGQRVPVRASGMVGQSARRPVARRQDQPRRAVAKPERRPAFALRGMLKIPTAKDDEEGVGTGKVDFALDAILSKEFNERVELSGFGGFIVRGDPDGVDLSNGIRWGFGAGFPTRKSLRLTAELHGEKYLDDRAHQLARS